MKRPARGLTPDEAALWARVAQTVSPLEARGTASAKTSAKTGATLPVTPRPHRAGEPRSTIRAEAAPPMAGAAHPGTGQGSTEHHRPADRHGLDASWDRKLARGIVAPDYTLDLHGASLDAAHSRLDHGLTLALSQGARLVLLITGRPRPSSDHAGRSERRGAIRAKLADWLAHGAHASRIAAIRPAHPRHGGAGAVYLVLRRAR